jgi:hypothetical protein
MEKRENPENKMDFLVSKLFYIGLVVYEASKGTKYSLASIFPSLLLVRLFIIFSEFFTFFYCY